MAKVTLLLSGRARLEAQFLTLSHILPLTAPSDLSDWEREAQRGKKNLSEVPWLVGGRVAIRTQSATDCIS